MVWGPFRNSLIRLVFNEASKPADEASAAPMMRPAAWGIFILEHKPG